MKGVILNTYKNGTTWGGAHSYKYGAGWGKGGSLKGASFLYDTVGVLPS